MILISKHTDRYDYIIHHRGRDNKIVFKRDYEESPFGWNKIATHNGTPYNYQLHPVRDKVRIYGVVVAGVVYPYISETTNYITGAIKLHRAIVDGKLVLEGKKSQRFWWNYNICKIGDTLPVSYIQELYDYQVQNNLPVINVCINSGREETSFYLKPQVLIKDVPLVVDDVQIVDGIYNMLSGMLDVNPPVELDDKMKLFKHGFNQMSFKKEKTKHR